MRLFAALDIPDDLRSAIARWQEGWSDPALRPVPAENLHMTLVFLGQVPDGDLDRVARAAFSGAAGHPAPRVRVDPEPVGVPRGKHPRLFALDTPSEEAAALQAGVEAGLVAAGLHSPEDRAFWPHLTVARVRSEKGRRRPMTVEDRPRTFPEHAFAFRPNRLVIYRSDLRRSGATYVSMAELELPTADETER